MVFSYILISPLRDTGKFPICCWHCPVHSSFFVLKIERKEKNYSFAFLPYCVLDTSQRCLKQAVYMKAEGDLWLFLYSEEKKKATCSHTPARTILTLMLKASYLDLVAPDGSSVLAGNASLGSLT